MASRGGIRGIRQTIPSGTIIGRSSPGNSKGAPQLLPLPPATQQAIVQGAGGKATSGGGSTGFGTISGGNVTLTQGPGIHVTGGPAYTVAVNPGQVPGEPSNGNASAGNVGEYVESIVTSSVSLTTGTATDITSISLTAGDWDVWGEAWTSSGGALTNRLQGWISPTSATVPTVPATNTSETQLQWGIITNGGVNPGTTGSMSVPIAIARVSISGTTTMFLSMKVAFSGGTMGGFGKICARRVR